LGRQRELRERQDVVCGGAAVEDWPKRALNEPGTVYTYNDTGSLDGFFSRVLAAIEKR
jgi:hypothetical protein